MGGIGLSCNTTSTGYLTHTHRTDTRYAHKMHTIRTQYAHNMHTILHTHTHTIHRYKIHTYTEYRTQIQQSCSTHRTEHNTGATQRTTEPQRTYTTQSCTHSFDFYHLHIYIKKLYNIAIYEFYTFCSPYL